MDRALYVSMSGAMQTMVAQTANNNNLANANTNGFRAQLVESQAVPVQGPGFQSRINTQVLDQGWDGSLGGLSATGRSLDVALRSNNWLAVQAPDGTEAYTRAGNLSVNSSGQLTTGNNLPVLGDSGPITVPPYSSISIADDGTISMVPAGQQPNTVAVVGRLKVVQADQSMIGRGNDGLMHPVQTGASLDSASGQVLSSGKLESSNVDVASTMVTMIQLARQFDMQTQLMKTVQSDSAASSTIVQMT